MPGWSHELEARHRVYCARAGCLFLGLAAYISFVPFNFSAIDRAQLLTSARAALTLAVESRTNFLANIVLFVPVGFFGAGALRVGPSSPAESALRGALLVVGMLAASVAIEGSQIFLPGRTPTGSDVLAQLLGGVCGIVFWLYAGREAAAWFGSRSQETAPGRAVVLLQAVVGVLTVAALLPLDVTFSASSLAAKLREGRITLMPFASHSMDAGLAQELITDALYAVPFGALAVLGWPPPRSRRRLATALAIAVAAIAGIEMCQVFIISRTADVTDIVTGTVGALGGAVLASRLSDATVSAGEVRRSGSAWARAGLMAVLVLYALTNLSPFDFTVSTGMLRERWPALLTVPFYSYYVNPEFQAFGTFVGKLVVSLPIGLFIRGAVAPRRQSLGRVHLLAAVTAMTAFFFGVEVGQIFLPSRFPDVTDVIIALIGVGLGVRLADLIARSAWRLHADLRQSSSGWPCDNGPGASST